jgi:uncharacterized protein YdaU (DUF1376 family)
VAGLYYMPLDVAAELASEANARMSAEQFGAFCRLKLRAWLSPQCSLPNDDVALAQLSGLGKKWKTVGEFVREQFAELEDDPSRIRNGEQWELYQASMAKHEARVRAGKTGGEAKAKGKQTGSNASPPSERDHSNQNQNHSQNQNENYKQPRPSSEYSDQLIDAMNETLLNRLGSEYHLIKRDQYGSREAAERLQKAGVPLTAALRILRTQCYQFNPSKHGKGELPKSLRFFEGGILHEWKSEPKPLGELVEAAIP